ncbi:MAG: hypothetical protein CL840_16065 [Crocinitomicaceae bacterium]|nr:hypothetical protein [Crocinitomicaceae bacterium]
MLNGIFAGFDIKVCDGDTAFLNATGGSLYTWKRISGDSIKPGINWFPDTTSSDTNKNVLFLPLSPTRLEVRSNLVNLCNKHSSSCNTVDTILVTPSDSFHIKTSPDQLLM